MKTLSFQTLALIYLLTTSGVLGGICWSAMVRNGRCTELVAEKVSRDQCCGGGGGGGGGSEGAAGSGNSVALSLATTAAYSDDDLDSGTLFFWRMLGGGVPCSPCKESCTGVKCGEGKRCVIRKGQPRCVCAPNCRAERQKEKASGRVHRGPVCGTDGRSYRTVCRLRKRACRRHSTSLQVAYYGLCQSSCDRIQCPEGKFCILDQNLSPHCVHCDRRCAAASAPSPLGPLGALGGSTPGQVCGVDGVTYDSTCHLRQAACYSSKAIPVAYRGKCRRGVTCSTIACQDKQTCVTEVGTGQPRCVTCSYRCPKPKQHAMTQSLICGSNNRTYHSWCHMLKDSCATGYVIDTKHPGSCNQLSTGNSNVRAVMNTVLDHSKLFS